MSEKAEILKLQTSENECEDKKIVRLDSGRQVLVRSDQEAEYIEITEPNGEFTLKVRMTDDGPVVSVHGARLELKSSETIALEAKKIAIRAEEEAVFESKGSLDMDAKKKMNIQCDDDVKLVGKIIHLN